MSRGKSASSAKRGVRERGTIYDRVADARARREAALNATPSETESPANTTRVLPSRAIKAAAEARALKLRAEQEGILTAPDAANTPADPTPAPPPNTEPVDETPTAPEPASKGHRVSLTGAMWIASIVIVAVLATATLWNGRTTSGTAPVPEAVRAPAVPALPPLSDLLPNETAPHTPEPLNTVSAPSQIAALPAAPTSAPSLPQVTDAPAVTARPTATSTDPADDIVVVSQPENVTATPEPAARPESEAPVTALASDLRVILNAPRTVPENRVASLATALRASGVAPEVRSVNLTISRDNVRYYHPQDSEAAALVADAIGASLRDFTDFAPSPPEGLVEVWLSGDSARPTGGNSTAAQLRRDLEDLERAIRNALR